MEVRERVVQPEALVTKRTGYIGNTLLRCPDPPAVPGGHKPGGPPLDPTEFDLEKEHAPIAVLRLGESDELAAHGFTDKHPRPAPLDLAVAVHAADLMGRVVPRVLKSPRIGAR